MFCFVIASCTKNEHSLKFENHSAYTVTSLEAGPVWFGLTAPGESQGYRPISEGTYTLNGLTDKGLISGQFSITGKGEHRWLLSLDEGGQVLLTREK